VPMPMPEPNMPTTPVQIIAPVEIEKEPVKTEVNLPPPPPPAPEPKVEPKPETSWQDMPVAALNWIKSIPKIWLLIGGGILLFILYAIFKPDPSYRAPKKGKDNSR
jgi:hypothetical protein